MDWFTVDKNGLAKLLEGRNRAALILRELLGNAWDTNATRVDVRVLPVPGSRSCDIEVEDDDPEGFADLAHAFTLYAESAKKGDPSKRGRFNIGEKLVLALCQSATISSTTGTVTFGPGGRSTSRAKRPRGSLFSGRIRLSRQERDELDVVIRRFIPQESCETFYNGQLLHTRRTIEAFDAKLPTEIADREGVLRKTVRLTRVTIHVVEDDETPMLYEMGIPVVELTGGERWHVNVHQKVPLNMDRDNVTPAYLQAVRVLLANHMKDRVTREDTAQVWCAAATGDERVDPEAMEKILDARFGRKRAIFDPNDLEANKQLINEGYVVIPGRALSGQQWGNIRKYGLMKPAGQIRPSGVRYDPKGTPERLVPPSSYTTGQQAVVKFAKVLAARLIYREIEIKIVNEPVRIHKAAWYCDGLLAFNVGRLGRDWFEQGIDERHLGLVLHELAHDKAKDHLTHEFSDEVTRLGVLLVNKCVRDPDFLPMLGYSAKAS